MPVPYGSKTGVTTVIKLVKHLCRIFLIYEAKIIAWADGNMSPTDAATFKAWIATTKAVCTLLLSTPDD